MRASLGSWVRAFFIAWLVTGVIGLSVAVTGLRPPEFAGFLALAAVTVVVHRLQGRPPPEVSGGEGGRAGDVASWLREWSPRGLGPDGLTGMRKVFLTYATALVLIGGVVVTIDASDDGIESSVVSPAAAAVAVVVLGVAATALVRLLPDSLDCTDQARLVGSYRTRFFMWLAIAEASALGGFVAVFLSGEAWIYWIGFVFAALNFWYLAPSDRNLARDQDRLATSGCPFSLVDLPRDARRRPP